MADVDSSAPGLDQTNKAADDTTNINSTDAGGTFAGDGSAKYGDTFAHKGTQNPEGTAKDGGSSGGTRTATPD